MNRSVSFIGIGSELMNGLVSDQNGPWLGKFLTQRGYRLAHLQLCGDHPEQLMRALATAHEHASIVVLSGGLGPTPDDLTKNILSQYYQEELLESAKALALIKTHYERKGLQFNPQMGHYHLIPKGFDPIENPLGLAPGLLGKKGEQFLLALPGVPEEFRHMFEQQFDRGLFSSGQLLSHREQLMIKIWEVSEEKILKDNHKLWEELSSQGTVSFLPQVLGVDIVIELEGAVVEREEKKRAILKMIESTTINKHIWQIGDLSLPEYILNKLQQQSATLGFCESCTGGLAAHSVTNIAGSSQVFRGSVVCYSNDVKRKLLGVSEESLNNHGAVSKQVALELAEGGKGVLNVDYCLSYTGIAGPGGGGPERPVGTVGIGLATPQKSSSQLFHFTGNRRQLKERFLRAGLFLLGKEL